MAIQWTEREKEIVNDPAGIKVLSTTDPEGHPHAVYKQTIHVNEDGYLEYWELIETSRSNRNMVHSIWFNKTVSVNVRSGDTSLEIIGKPYRAIVAGGIFEENYKKARELLGDVDLSTVWLIEPLQIREETFAVRWKAEDEAHPILRHLDRLTVPEQEV